MSPARGGSVAWALAALALVLPAGATEETLLYPMRAAVVDVRAAALLMSGQEGGALPLALAVLPPLAGEPGITVLAEVAGEALHGAGQADEPLGLEVFVYALGDDLEVVALTTQQLVVAAEQRDSLRRGGLKILVPLELGTGEAMLRVLVRAGSDAFGLRSLPLALPPAVALPPLPAELSPGWLVAAPRGAALPGPWRVAGELHLPTARPILTPRQSRSMHVFLRRPGSGAGLLFAIFTDADGGTEEVPLTLGEPADSASADGAPGWRALTAAMEVPVLTGGTYRLSLAWRPVGGTPAGGTPVGGTPEGGAGEELRSSPLAVLVTGGLAAVVETPREELTPAPPSPARRLGRQLTEAYLRALGELAAGQRRRALATLLAAERRFADRVRGDPLFHLREVESRAFARLGEQAWPAALPVILLHADLAAEYRRRTLFPLDLHAHRRAVALAAAYAREVATPEARQEAAWVVAGEAAALLSGSRGEAETLYKLALELLGEADDSVLLALAALYEKTGRYQEAAETLRRLTAVRPHHDEGRLRLAVSLARLGESGRAAQLLGELVEDAGSEWVREVAVQEAARLEMEHGRLEQAAGVLRRGLELWPSHPALLIQLTYVLELRGEPLAARVLVAELASGARHAAGLRESGRNRYNSWPLAGIHRSRRQLAEQALPQRAQLARLVAALAEGARP